LIFATTIGPITQSVDISIKCEPFGSLAKP